MDVDLLFEDSAGDEEVEADAKTSDTECNIRHRKIIDCAKETFETGIFIQFSSNF